jgi:hypothetical protein
MKYAGSCRQAVVRFLVVDVHTAARKLVQQYHGGMHHAGRIQFCALLLMST